MSEKDYYDTLQASIQQHTNSANFWTGESARHEQSRNDMISRTNAFINGFAQRNAVTLEVGAGKPYASITDAYNVIRDKVLTAPVLIKVANGIHDCNSIHLGHHAFAHKIRIEGNVANPANCVIRWVPDSNGDSHGIIMRSMQDINISGFKFVGDMSEANFTHRSIHAADSYFFSDDNSLIFEGGMLGVELINSRVYSIGLRASGIASSVVIGQQKSAASVGKMIVTGNGLAKSRAPTRYGGYEVDSRGVWMMDSGFANISESKFNNVRYGVLAERGASIEFSKSEAVGCHVGFLVIFGANMRSLEGAKSTNCEHGFISDHGSQMMVGAATADGCKVVGFRCSAGSNMYGNNTTSRNNNVGYQSIYGSVLNVPNSNANATGNTVLRDVDANSKLIWS